MTDTRADWRLADARRVARKRRTLVDDGRNPAAERRAEKVVARTPAPGGFTFGDLCDLYVKIMKYHTHRGVTPRFSFYRDQKGHECDLVIEQGDRVMAVEIKSGQTVASDVFAAMSRVVEDLRAAPGVRSVHPPGRHV